MRLIRTANIIRKYITEDLERCIATKIYSFVSLKTDVSSMGLGLGLPLVKKIVDNHAGRVAITSELGSGTSCELLFPLTMTNPRKRVWARHRRYTCLADPPEPGGPRYAEATFKIHESSLPLYFWLHD